MDREVRRQGRQGQRRESDERFRDQAAALGRWLRASDGRLPDPRSDDEHERRLGTWRMGKITRLRRGTLPPDHEQHLDAAAPGWRPKSPATRACPVTREERFLARAAELGRWLRASDGRPPIPHSDDEHERQLARWVRRLVDRSRDGELSRDREQHLDAIAPGWRRTSRREERFQARAAELGRWLCSSDGRVPRHDSDDTHERRLAGWRRRQLDQLHRGELPRSREECLDAAAPGWRTSPRTARAEPRKSVAPERQPVRRERFDPDRAEPRDEHAPSRRGVGQEPVRGSQRRPAQAPISPQRARLVAERQRKIEEKERRAAERQQEHDETFQSRAAELGRWLRSSGGRLPTTKADDEHERRLASWRAYQVDHLSFGGLARHREKHLDVLAPGWRPGPRARRASLLKRQADVVAWVQEHGTLPQTSVDDPEELRLWMWLSDQATLAREERLTPEHARWLDAHVPGWRDVSPRPSTATEPGPTSARDQQTASARTIRIIRADRAFGGLQPQRPPVV